MTLRVGTKWKLQLTINFISGDNKISNINKLREFKQDALTSECHEKPH